MSEYKVIDVAEAEVGYLEKASNSNLDSKTGNAGSANYTKYARDIDNISGFYNGRKNGFAWCDVFVDWCFVKAYGSDKAKAMLYQPNYSAGAGCSYSADYFRAKGRFYTSPKVGDQIFFGTRGDEYHTGIVYKVTSSTVYTIEGNTSNANGVVDNGGGVWKKSYSLNYSKISGYGRPNYSLVGEPKSTASASPAPSTSANVSTSTSTNSGSTGGFDMSTLKTLSKGSTGAQVKSMQLLLKGYGYSLGWYGADGDFGSATEKALLRYQANNGLVADGYCGPKTWAKLLGA